MALLVARMGYGDFDDGDSVDLLLRISYVSSNTRNMERFQSILLSLMEHLGCNY